MKNPFMSQARRDAIKREHAANKARRTGSSSGPVYYQNNHFYADGTYTSETTGGSGEISSGSGYASRSDTDYGSRDSGSSSYDSGSSYDGGSGSYGE